MRGLFLEKVGKKLQRSLGMVRVFATLALIMFTCLAHSDSHWHSLPYDGGPNWCFGVRVGMWSINSLSRKGGEDCEELRN